MSAIAETGEDGRDVVRRGGVVLSSGRVVSWGLVGVVFGPAVACGPG